MEHAQLKINRDNIFMVERTLHDKLYLKAT
jgi:hypothetical protein